MLLPFSPRLAVGDTLNTYRLFEPLFFCEVRSYVPVITTRPSGAAHTVTLRVSEALWVVPFSFEALTCDCAARIFPITSAAASRSSGVLAFSYCATASFR